MKYEVKWRNGCSELFLTFKGEKPKVLDYEYDTDRLHEMCGGMNYYRSRGGCSGAGFFTNLGSLLPLGAYRVDTARNEFQGFLPVGKVCDEGEYVDVLVAVPYASHTKDKTEILRDHPTVVKFGKTVVYCDFGRNFDILKTVLTGKKLPEECEIGGVTYSRRGHRTLKRSFTKPDRWGDAREEDVTMEFYNLCSMKNTPNPWEFFQGELAEFQAEWVGERMFQLLAVEELRDGTFVQTMSLDGMKYRGKILAGDPLKTGDLTAGWQRVADDVLIRFYDRSNEAHLVAYAPARGVREKIARRIAGRMGESEEFISFVSSCESQYTEYELVVPKALWLIDKATQLAEVRKGLARKIHEDVSSRASQWAENVKDQAILEAIPDDMVITFADSLDAGNCRPGTEAFVAQYFPGKTSTTAKELKEHSNNYHVMRIFRHLAETGRFEWRRNE